MTELASAEVPVSADVLAASAALDAATAPPEPQRPVVTAAAQGDARDPNANWVVQVGAFRDQSVAQEWLGEVGRRFRDHFRNAEGGVTAAANGWFRARYMGFTRSAADAACESLEQRNVPCMVMRGN